MALLPRPSDVLHVVAAPATYLPLAALVLLGLAKASVLRQLSTIDNWPSHLARVLADDLAVTMGLAACLALLEHRRAWLRWVTVPVALAAFGVVAANATYLTIAGEQLSLHTLATGIARIGDVGRIITEILTAVPQSIRAATAVAILAPLMICRRRLRRRGQLGDHALERARCVGAVAVAGMLTAVAVEPTTVVPVNLLSGSVLTDLLRPAMIEAHESRQAPAPQTLVDPAGVTTLRDGRRPNVVMVVVESLRWDRTSLAVGSGASTPALEALAARGTQVKTTRAVVPHTTKSLWTILCGRPPTIGPDMFEASGQPIGQCLPHVLDAAGYKTAMFQSAHGTFEDRPRLAANLGFGQFAAWEDIGGEPLGYLASDDSSLLAPFRQFLDDHRGVPFGVVLLTSAMHFPYRLSPALAAQAAAAGDSAASNEGRYLRLVEAADQLVAAVVAALTERGLIDDTVVVVLGDHGEGFGAQGVKQHDTNFFEEGLRVPWVLAGPGVPRQSVSGNGSLLDVLPTVLAVIGVPVAAQWTPQGGSVLGGAAPGGPRPFVCWFPSRCRGFVEGARKVVEVPGRRRAFVFDLNLDHNERRARSATDEELRTLREVLRDMGAAPAAVVGFPALARPYTPWQCALGDSCRHPNSPTFPVATP